LFDTSKNLRNKGLLDDHPDVLAFFDHYVHDSITGFGLDATLPSDPRAIYVGKDRESPYAGIHSSPDREPAMGLAA